jgi:hypothetical protein
VGEVPEAIQPVPNAFQTRAMKQRQVLGMDRGRPSAQLQPIEKEVDRYLSDEEIGTGPLEFWQVGPDSIILT